MGRLIERLQASPVICAEGYLFELERRGYLQAGAFVPEVVLEHPDAVLQLHREHLRAGSDVMVAFTYYGHRDKLRIIGKEDLLEPLNKNALALAKQAAAEDESGRVLVAGNICNTNIYDPAAAEKTGREATAMFEEQIGWARDAGVDFILAETFSFHEEAMLALQACKRAGMEAVVNVVSHATGKLRDGPTPAESCKMLEDAGAEVVGMNCNRGPATMWPLLVEIRQAVACEVAAIPVPFRTNVRNAHFSIAARFRRRIVFARGHARVSGRDRCARLHPLRDGRFRAPLRRRRHSFCRRLLRRRPAPCPLDGRGAGAATARVALLARHVEALRARRQSGAQAIEPRFSGEIVTAAARR